MELEVIRPGVRVGIGDDNIHAQITGVTIRGNPPRISSYEIARFINGEHKAEWVEEVEVNPVSADDRIKIGFLENE